MNTDIKQTHETESCQRFLAIYNQKRGESLNFLRQGNPNNKEPDCICSNNVAIELVGTYDNEYQAEKIWDSARGKTNKRRPNYLLLTFDNLQNEIEQKLQKLENGSYNGFIGKIILVCNLHSPLLQDKEIEGYVKSYTSFRSDGYFKKYFNEVWVSWKSDRDENWEIKKLE